MIILHNVALSCFKSDLLSINLYKTYEKFLLAVKNIICSFSYPHHDKRMEPYQYTTYHNFQINSTRTTIYMSGRTLNLVLAW